MMKRRFVAFFIVIAVLVMQTVTVMPAGTAPDGADGPVRIIMDQDMSSDWDDVADLAVANALADLGECEIIACMANADDGDTALCMNAINTYYGRSDVPCGTRSRSKGGKFPSVIASEFPHPKYPTVNDTPLCLDLYKEVLSQQPDNSVVIVTTGFLTNLEELMKDPEGMKLIQSKVKMLACAGGVYPKKGGEFNFTVVPEAAEYVINNWPGQAFFDGYNIGQDVMSGIDLLYSAKMDNPVRRVWQIYKDGHMGQSGWDGAYPTWAQIMVYFAVRNEECMELFDIHTTGYNFVFPDGQNEWRTDRDPSGAQEQGYLIEKQRQATQDSINTLVNDSIYPRSQGTQAPPNKPTNVRAEVTDSGTILQWNDNSWNETDFTVERRIGSSGPYTVIGTVNAGVTTLMDTGITTGNARDINYRVTANNELGSTESTVLAVYSGWTETNEARPGTPVYIQYQNNLTYPWITADWPDGSPEMKHTAYNNDAYHGKSLKVNVKVSNDSPHGNIYLYFFYQDPDNWYRLNVGSAQESGGCTKFEKCIGGTVSQIGGTGKGYYMNFGSQMQTWELVVLEDGTMTYWSNNADEYPYTHLKRGTHEVLTVKDDNLSFAGGGLAVGTNHARPGWGNFLYETDVDWDGTVKNVSISPATAQLSVGTTQQLIAAVFPPNAANQAVQWSTSNANVAAVSDSGVVTGVSNGTATITAKTDDGGYTASCLVTVAGVVPVAGVNVSPASASLIIGDTRQFTAEITPADATDKTVTWSSSNTAVATVSESGLVTANTAGTAAITATTQDGGKTASSTVTVTAPEVKLTGQVIGTSGSFGEPGHEIDKAFDGDTDTYAEIHGAENIPWAGLDLGVERRITSIRYYPTPDSAETLAGGKFQGANTPDFSDGVVDLYTIPTEGEKIRAVKQAPVAFTPAKTIYAETFEQLKTALNSNEDAKIIVTADIEVESSITVDGGHKILVAQGEKTICRKEGYTGKILDMFYSIVDLQIGEEHDTDNMLIFDGKDVAGSEPPIMASGGTFTIKNGIFKNFKGAGEGGVIYNGGTGAVIVDGGTFDNCRANNTGGAICSRGGNVTINGGVFTNCTPNTGNCWAAVHVLNGSTLTINGGTFKDCDRDAIWVNSESTLNLLGGTFENCRFYIYTGGEQGTLNVSESIYTAMPADKFYVDVGGGWEITFVPDGPGAGWKEITLDTPGKFRYVRFLAPSNGILNMAEIAFYTREEAAPTINAMHITENKVTNVTIWSDEPQDGRLLVAAYNGDGILIGLKILPVPSSIYTDGIADIAVNYTLPEGTAKVTAMLWKDFSNIRPLTNPLSIEI